MTRRKKWTAVLLAAVMLLGLLPAAAAEEPGGPFAGAVQVEDFEQFKAALADETVKAIAITGKVEVDEGSLEEPFEANKPIYVTLDGSLALAEGAAIALDVPQGQFTYELPDDGSDEALFQRIAEDMAVFLMWEQNGRMSRLLLGSQPDDLADVFQHTAQDSLLMAVFRDGATLDSDVTANMFYVMNGDLNIQKGATLTVGGYLWVNGSVNDFGGGLVAENDFYCNEYNRPRLLVCWGEDEHGDPIYDRWVFMTPYDEYEVTFAAYDYAGGQWTYTPLGADDLRIPSALSYGFCQYQLTQKAQRN